MLKCTTKFVVLFDLQDIALECEQCCVLFALLSCVIFLCVGEAMVFFSSSMVTLSLLSNINETDF